jgi:hypothetical protein
VCTGADGLAWQVTKRFRQFREFRMALIKAGAAPLKTVSFPRKTVGKSKDKTDAKRQQVLNAWLNLVISVYCGQPAIAPHIIHFLDVSAMQPCPAVSSRFADDLQISQRASSLPCSSARAESARAYLTAGWAPRTVPQVANRESTQFAGGQHGGAITLERICGEWHARGLNEYRQDQVRDARPRERLLTHCLARVVRLAFW